MTGVLQMIGRTVGFEHISKLEPYPGIGPARTDIAPPATVADSILALVGSLAAMPCNTLLRDETGKVRECRLDDKCPTCLARDIVGELGK